MSKLEFWVYDNHHRSRGRIHRGSCGDCNYGEGKSGTVKRRLDRWIGFETRDAAFAAARRLCRADMKPCAKCEP